MITDPAPGVLVTNGSSAMMLTERVDRDPRWKVPGWRGVNVGIGQYGGDHGFAGFLADYLASSWKRVPLEWTALPGGALEERYEQVGGRLYRQVRKIEESTE
jgi:hypothetical protein